MQKSAKYAENILLIKKEQKLPLDKPLILFASKLKTRNGPMDLLKAYHRLRDRPIQAALIFVGSGSEEEMLKVTSVPHYYPYCTVEVQR
jgi:glycosyltransferase involved in cell wall biosynthesis